MQYCSAADISLKKHGSMLLAEVHKTIDPQCLLPDTPEDIVWAVFDEAERNCTQTLGILNEYKELFRTRQVDAAHALERCRQDPVTGQCDAICTITSRRILSSLHAEIPLFQRSESTSATIAEQASEGGDVKGDVSDPLTGCYAKDFSSSMDILSKLIKQFQLDGIDEAEFCFDLPILVVEHKKEPSMVQGPNKLRMDLAACTAFLEALCITKFPVFGLSTNGSQGVVTCCEVELVEVPLNEGEKYPLKVSIAILICSTVFNSAILIIAHCSTLASSNAVRVFSTFPSHLKLSIS